MQICLEIVQIYSGVVFIVFGVFPGASECFARVGGSIYNVMYQYSVFASYSKGYYITVMLNKASIGVFEHSYMLVKYIAILYHES